MEDFENLNEGAQWPRLLVLSGAAPGTDGVGAILLRQILGEIPRERLRFVHFRSWQSNRPEGANDSFEVDLTLSRRFENVYRPLGGIMGEGIAALAHFAKTAPHQRRLRAQCVGEGANFGAEAVLAVLDCPTVIALAREVAEKLGIPLYVFVMDAPRSQVAQFGYSGLLMKRLLAAFDRTMKMASRMAVAGESMGESYRRQYGKQAVILRQGLPYDSASRSEAPISTGILRIGFAGSLTALDGYEELLAELGRRDWKIGDRNVVLRIVGTHLRLKPTSPQHIEFFGWRLVPEMIGLMAECDFLYMPQPFSENLREVTELSFPNKLCTYVPARRPIMLHAPPNASLSAFFKRFPCGPQSTDLNAADLIDQMELAINDTARYAQYRKAVELAHGEELNESRLRSEARRFLASESSAKTLN